MVENKSAEKSSHAYKKGDLVVFKDICWDDGDYEGMYSDYLHEVVKVHRASNYLEIRETKCCHSNRRSWGSDGTDIRKANDDEIRARSRLPKTISYTSSNPDGAVVMNEGSTDLFHIKHYVKGNTLLIVGPNKEEILVEIFDIREASPEERLIRKKIIK